MVHNLTEPPLSTTAKKLFGRSTIYFDIASRILPRLTTHRYQFLPNDAFFEWIERENVPIGKINYILVRELLDNAHLAATTALARTILWSEAMCVSYEYSNFVAWASAARGLLESSGDIGDGLSNIAASLAKHHILLSAALAGLQKKPLDLRPLEEPLSHFIRAKWTRDKSGETPRAKDNVEYVRWIGRADIPGIVALYHKLCGITHPSSGSLDYMYTNDADGLRLDINSGGHAIDEICAEFLDVFPASVMLSCNSTLLILRVLHKFGRHPKLPEDSVLKFQQKP